MKIALLGYGTVGRAVVSLLQKRDVGISVKTILRRKGKASDPGMTDCFDNILRDPEIGCIAEALSGTEPAASYIKRALCAGKPVVSANKAALASCLPALLSLADENGVPLLFEASCGGGIPWLENIKKAAGLDRITTLSGILNGTSNYILDRMERSGLSFSEALSEAQARGYAEADPSADISGFDVRNKAIISCTLAYQTRIHTDIPVSGIAFLTKELLDRFHALGKSVRLEMYSLRTENRYALGVVPLLLPKDSIEAQVRENFNCASLTGDLVGTLKFFGQGAGGDPTADAIIQDLLLVKSGSARPVRLSAALQYDEKLLLGTGYFGDGHTAHDTLSALTASAKKRNTFLAFSPDAPEAL